MTDPLKKVSNSIAINIGASLDLSLDSPLKQKWQDMNEENCIHC